MAPVHGTVIRLPAGLLTRIQPSDAPSRRGSGLCIARHPHSAGHVADSHRIPDSPSGIAGKHRETLGRMLCELLFAGKFESAVVGGACIAHVEKLCLSQGGLERCAGKILWSIASQL